MSLDEPDTLCLPACLLSIASREPYDAEERDRRELRFEISWETLYVDHFEVLPPRKSTPRRSPELNIDLLILEFPMDSEYDAHGGRNH